MKHIKVLALVGALLATGACSVKGPSLEEQFLANFNGFSKAVSLDGLDDLLITEGGRTVGLYRFVSAQSPTNATYSITLTTERSVEFVFPETGRLVLSGAATYTLEK